MNCDDKTQVVNDSSWFTTMNCDRFTTMNCDKTQDVDDSSWFTTMNCDKTQVVEDSSWYTTMNCDDKTQDVDDSSWFTTMNCDTVKPRSLKIHHDLRQWIVIIPRSLMIHHDLLAHKTLRGIVIVCDGLFVMVCLWWSAIASATSIFPQDFPVNVYLVWFQRYFDVSNSAALPERCLGVKEAAKQNWFTIRICTKFCLANAAEIILKTHWET